MPQGSTPTHIQRRLSSLGITHLDNFDVSSLVDVVHRLRSDEDKLPTNRTSSCLNNHMHASLTVYAVHENVAKIVSETNPNHCGITYNSSRQRIGEPIASQRESRRQTVEYDFSPPERVFVCLPSPLRSMMSGWTWPCKQRIRTCTSNNLRGCLEGLWHGRY